MELEKLNWCRPWLVFNADTCREWPHRLQMFSGSGHVSTWTVSHKVLACDDLFLLWCIDRQAGRQSEIVLSWAEKGSECRTIQSNKAAGFDARLHDSRLGLQGNADGVHLHLDRHFTGYVMSIPDVQIICLKVIQAGGWNLPTCQCWEYSRVCPSWRLVLEGMSLLDD